MLLFEAYTDTIMLDQHCTEDPLPTIASFLEEI